MKQIEIKGNNLNAIISNYRKKNRIKDWELQYEIVSEASNGFLGLFGKKQAVVKFSQLNTEERIVLFVEQLLQHMELRFDKITSNREHKTVFINVHNSSDAGFLIGKNGSMLEQLQYLVNRVFENVHDLERIYIDTEDYRQRQEQTFLRTYLPQIKKVKSTGKSITLEPMQSSDRRIIHKFVEAEPELKTLTIGEGEFKRIVIMPAAQKENDPAVKKTATPFKQHSGKSHQGIKPSAHKPRRPNTGKKTEKPAQ